MTAVLPSSPRPMQDQKREYEMAQILGLQWNSSVTGYDALDEVGNEWELKSSGVGEFAIGRDINLKKIEDCERRYWAFAFYADKTSDQIDRLFICHPDAISEKWKALKRKFRDAEWYAETIWKHAEADMVRHSLPTSLIAHFREEIQRLFHRGGQTLPNQAITRTMVEASVALGLGIQIDRHSHIPVPLQVAQFVSEHPIRKSKPKSSNGLSLLTVK